MPLPVPAPLRATEMAHVGALMAGLGLSDQKNAARRNHTHRHRLQIAHEPQKKWALESPTGESLFSGFD
jgi:hypothetical protein